MRILLVLFLASNLFFAEHHDPAKPRSEGLPEKPTLVVISHEVGDNPTGEVDGECFNFIHLKLQRGFTGESVMAELAEKNLPKNSYFLISMHGGLVDEDYSQNPELDKIFSSPRKSWDWRKIAREVEKLNPDRPYRVGGRGGPKIDGDKFVQTIASGFPQGKFWLATCMSGRCKVKDVCLGTECGPVELSTESDNKAWKKIQNMICSPRSSHSRCRLFNQYDANHDGYVRGEELQLYVGNDASLKSVDIAGANLDELKQNIEKEKAKCKPVEGRLVDFTVYDSGAGYEITKEEWKRKPTQGLAAVFRKETEEKVGVATSILVADTAADFSNELAYQFPKWPDDCTSFFDPANTEYRNCKIKKIGLGVKAVCRQHTPGIPANLKRNHPEARSFEVYGPECKQMWERKQAELFGAPSR